MSDDQNAGGGEKSNDPTQKKLDDAREKGDVVRSTDISVTAAYLGLILAFALSGQAAVEKSGQVLAGFLGNSDTLSQQILSSGGQTIASRLFLEIGRAVSPIFFIPMLLVVASILAQRAFVFAPSKLAFKLSRISPLSVAKNKFGPSGLFEFAKSFFKLVIVSLTVALFIKWNSDGILGSLRAEGRGVSFLIAENLTSFLWLVFAISLVISAVDYLWQSYDHKRKLMMSRQEIVDENKGMEGDPHVKQQRRQRAYDIATNRMIADVPDADVIIVNPEHYAVALKWSGEKATAPVCLAKGVDEVAARIREAAAAAGVPIHRDPPAARAIHASVEVGQEIWPEHYKAVAAAIRFAERVRKSVAGSRNHE